jgi:hypothetical protein
MGGGLTGGYESQQVAIKRDLLSMKKGGVKLLASVDISAHGPWIMLNEQHIMACTSTKHCKIVLGCKIPQELDALKWKATGRGDLGGKKKSNIKRQDGGEKD